MTIISRNTFLLICGLFLAFFTRAQQPGMETTKDGNCYFVRQLNGLDALLLPDPKASNIVITYNVKIGPVYEGDSTSGISYILQGIMADKIKMHLQNAQNKISNQNTTFKATTTTEQTIFELSTSPANYSACLQLFCDSLNLSNIHESELLNKIDQVKKEIESEKGNYLSEFDKRLIRAVYRHDANRQLIKGDTTKFRNIDINRVRIFYKRYYGPNNVIINATGNFDPVTFENEMATIFKVIIKPDFDPQLVSKVVDFKPMLYNVRFTINAPVQRPELYLCWQFPGTRSNLQSSYYAFLLASMLNDPNNYIQIKLRKMGCQKFTATYVADNFSGLLKIQLEPDNNNFYQTYAFVLKELQRLDKTILNEGMVNAAKLNFTSQLKQIRNSNEYATLTTKYWVFNDETYFPSLRDSIFSRNIERMRKFIIEYLNQSAYVTGLMINQRDRDAIKIDSAFVDLNDSINNIVFTYRRNIPDIEGDENKNKLNRLVQWLQCNPDLTIQVNGFADAKEYNKFKDDTIRAFIDSVPTFERVKAQIINTSTFRLEMLRALKIVKYLYEHGIDPTRLKGTSMTFSSKTKEEERDNMKCTLTIDKIKLSPSLYEYHYGHPPDGNQR